MESQFRTSYNSNKETLRELCSQLGVSTIIDVPNVPTLKLSPNFNRDRLPAYLRTNVDNPTLTDPQKNHGTKGVSKQEDKSESNMENILLAIGIFYWILVFATDGAHDYEGTWLFIVIVPPWIVFFMWYTPIMLIVKIIRFFKNN
jgi:hypothetical protein